MWKPKYFHEMMTNSVTITNAAVAQPVLDQAAEPEDRQARVHEGGRLEHAGEDDAGDGLGEDVGQEEDQPEDGPAGEAAVEQHREPERERDLDRRARGR